MKKTLTIIAAIAFSSFALAQSFQLSAFGTGKSTWLFNKSISDQGDIQDYAAGWGYNYGIGATYLFTEHLGAEVGFMLNQHNGNYEGQISIPLTSSVSSYTSHLRLQTMDIPLLFHVQSESGAYFEVGPQYSMITGSNFYFTDSAGTTKMGTKAISAKTNFSAMLGMGVNIFVGNHLQIRTGFRFEYGLTDLKGVDALGYRFDDPFVYKTPFNATNSAAGGLMFGLAWSFNAREKSESAKGNKLPPPPPPPSN